MKRFILGCAAVVALAVAGTKSVEAGGIHVSVGSGHYGHSHSGSGYGGPIYGGGYGYGKNILIYPQTGNWHDTSHWDYHPGGFVRHRNHFHYVPGHWDYHQTGHWHRY